MELRSHKRKRSSVGNGGGRDRLSEMPDEVIVHILSFMPIVYAVRTVLLRPFGNLWTLVHTLKLDMLGFLGSFWTNHEWDEKDDERFCIFVRNVLALHKRPTINKFHLCVEFSDSKERTKVIDDIKTWLRFALDRQASEIKFSDGLDYGRTSSSLLPNFTSQSLVTLALGFCKIETQLQVNLPSLKKLSLDHCRMSNEELQRFISGCRSLQELVIVEPSDIEKLSFSAPNIDKLSLVLPFEHQNRKPLSLECPNIKTLFLEIDDRLDIIDIPSVCDIYIKEISFGTNNEYIPGTLGSIYGKLDGAELIHLSCVATQQLLDSTRHFSSLFNCKWKRVVLELKELNQLYFAGFCRLARCLRHMEELIIYTTDDFKACTESCPSEDDPSFIARQLKTIILYGSGKSWKTQLQLVEFFLKGAATLNELFILPIKHRLEAAEELEFVKRVSRLPRASTIAKVMFG